MRDGSFNPISFLPCPQCCQKSRDLYSLVIHSQPPALETEMSSMHETWAYHYFPICD